MAYKSDNLSVLAYANGFTLWHYTTPDAAGTVDTAGYFDDAADMLRTGDMVLANTEPAAAPGPACSSSTAPPAAASMSRTCSGSAAPTPTDRTAVPPRHSLNAAGRFRVRPAANRSLT